MLLIISAPSGCGKTTVTKKILELDKSFTVSVSTTTRQKRPNEIDGIDYQFISIEEFKSLIEQDAFVENFKIFDNFYGTQKDQLAKKMENKNVILDIDWQGTQKTKKLFDGVVSIFLLPPSLGELEKRLNSRGQDSQEIISNRMHKAKAEISHFSEYDYVLINNDFDETIENVMSIISAEKIKQGKKIITEFVETKILHVPRGTFKKEGEMVKNVSRETK